LFITNEPKVQFTLNQNNQASTSFTFVSQPVIQSHNERRNTPVHLAEGNILATISAWGYMAEATRQFYSRRPCHEVITMD